MTAERCDKESDGEIQEETRGKKDRAKRDGENQKSNGKRRQSDGPD